MELKDWIPVVSAFIVALGWFVTGYLNRVKDVAQKRLEYRLIALEAFVPAWLAVVSDKEALSRPEVLAQFMDARGKLHLYGLDDENELMAQLVSAINKKDMTDMNRALGELVSLIRSRIRDELEMDTRHWKIFRRKLCIPNKRA